MKTTRRKFLQGLGAFAAGLFVSKKAKAAQEAEDARVLRETIVMGVGRKSVLIPENHVHHWDGRITDEMLSGDAETLHVKFTESEEVFRYVFKIPAGAPSESFDVEAKGGGDVVLSYDGGPIDGVEDGEKFEMQMETQPGLTSAAKRVMLNERLRNSSDVLGDFFEAINREAEFYKRQTEAIGKYDWAKAMQDWADEMGREPLTAAEKQQAFLNHVLERGNENHDTR